MSKRVRRIPPTDDAIERELRLILTQIRWALLGYRRICELANQLHAAFENLSLQLAARRCN